MFLAGSNSDYAYVISQAFFWIVYNPWITHGKASKSRGTAPEKSWFTLDRGIFEDTPELTRSGTCFVWGLWNFCLRGRLVELNPCSLFQFALV